MSSDDSLPLLRPVMPELDSIRGIAILLVVFFHAFFWSFGVGATSGPLGRFFLQLTSIGWAGVNLFFVLSGFLITGILLDSRSQPNYYGRFYLRRALRILPVYYSLLVLQLVMGWSTRGYFVLNLLYLSNVTEFFGVRATYGPLWSLAVEEHYYFLWPAVVKRLNRRQLTFGAVALCVLLPILRGVCFVLGYKAGLRSYTWFVADNLAAGSLLAIFLRSSVSRRQVSRVCAILLLLGGSLLVVGAPYGVLSHGEIAGVVSASLQYSVLGIFFSGVLLLFLLIGASRWYQWAAIPVLQFFGYISYGLYLIHMLAFSIYDALCRRFVPFLQPQHGRFGLMCLRFLLGGGLGVAIAYLSRRFFEDRFLALKKPLEAKFLDAESRVRIPVVPEFAERD